MRSDRYQNGVLVESIESPDDPRELAGRTLTDRLRQGIEANQSFRAIPTPTAAQQTAYLKSVARQLSALERLALGNLDSTAD